ncbi:hypothetical protein [Desulfuribacillus alkaliarsenatis]|uniref:Uncharacterized protein n=1 Tax=Desulfuribacillus alkaliarsenatis TaxID=766136 RepID=A0A1E5G5U4_9FIRM|nr:hypothetical protein [Desulfuribacillus alkaliarsenatis]OEF98479.1 hypothetical protein BHF68_02040 [Desulfuribacillus alkaliarsenatis]
MKKPIRVTLTFSNPLLTRAIKDVIGNNETFLLSESKLNSITCDDVENIDVILCETEVLERLEKEHICLAPKTLGISVWNNMISISKGDLQAYDDLDEIVDCILQIADKAKLRVKCDLCLTESKDRRAE